MDTVAENDSKPQEEKEEPKAKPHKTTDQKVDELLEDIDELKRSLKYGLSIVYVLTSLTITMGDRAITNSLRNISQSHVEVSASSSSHPPQNTTGSKASSNTDSGNIRNSNVNVSLQQPTSSNISNSASARISISNLPPHASSRSRLGDANLRQSNTREEPPQTNTSGSQPSGVGENSPFSQTQ